MSFGARFLAFPDLFPARRAGEPWGDRGVALDLPGGPYLVSGLSVRQEAAAHERFGALCSAAWGSAPAGIQSRLFTAPAADFLPLDTRGWEYAMDFDHDERSVRLAGLHLMARLDWAPALGGALWTSEERELFPGIFENLLRVLVAYRLVELGGAVLHSAGVTDGDGAFLFLGPSGAGKTTLSRLSEAAGRTVLSDDLNALLPGPGPGRAQVVKLPFTGDLGERREGSPPRPLRGLLQLAKGPEDALQPLSSGAALALLFTCSPFVNADPLRRERLLDILAGLAAAAPARVLTFSLAGDFWSILSKAFS
ncbi:MAG TPA: hypothetical protein VFE33_21610 [Thermoanaerobaculia bacterium]|nr:hypothetical protein [Thermoanaerobaculia bacterium]